MIPDTTTEWTGDEIYEGRQMVFTMGDQMLDEGIPHEEAQRTVDRYLDQIGTGTFNSFANRIHATTRRKVPRGKA